MGEESHGAVFCALAAAGSLRFLLRFLFLYTPVFFLLFQRNEEELSRGESTAYKKKKREKRRKTKEKDMSITPEMKLISVKSAAPSPRQMTKSFSPSYIIRKFYNL